MSLKKKLIIIIVLLISLIFTNIIFENTDIDPFIYFKFQSYFKYLDLTKWSEFLKTNTVRIETNNKIKFFKNIWSRDIFWNKDVSKELKLNIL